MKISERNGSQQCVLMNSSVHCWKNEGLPSCVGAPRHCFAGRPYGMLREGERLGSRTAKLASPWLWVTSVSWTSLVPPAAGLCPEWGISHSATLTALQSIACGRCPLQGATRSVRPFSKTFEQQWELLGVYR